MAGEKRGDQRWDNRDVRCRDLLPNRESRGLVKKEYVTSCTERGCGQRRTNIKEFIYRTSSRSLFLCVSVSA